MITSTHIEGWNNVRAVISHCFSSDYELMSKWHISAPSSLDNCVSRTVNDLRELSVFNFYMISENETIGFFGKEIHNQMTFLTAFFIKPKYRTKEIFERFWGEVKKNVGNDFYCGIYNKNERAKRFLEKSNGKCVGNDNEIAVYKFNIQ